MTEPPAQEEANWHSSLDDSPAFTADIELRAVRLLDNGGPRPSLRCKVSRHGDWHRLHRRREQLAKNDEWIDELENRLEARLAALEAAYDEDRQTQSGDKYKKRAFMTDTPSTVHESTDQQSGVAPTTRRTWLVLLTGSALGGNGAAMAVANDTDLDPDDVTVLSVHGYGEGGYGVGVYGGIEIVVETKDPTGISDTEATLVGDLVATGGNDEVDVSFAYDEADEPELDQSADAGVLGEEARFDAEIVDLAPDTEYEFRAVAEADGETASGEIGSFQTLAEDQTQICTYTNDDGVITLSGVRSAINDWQDGAIDTDVLIDAVDQWAAGEPVEDCV